MAALGAIGIESSPSSSSRSRGAYYFFILRHEQQAVGVMRRRLKPIRDAKITQTKLVAERRVMSAIGPLDAYLSRGQSSVSKLETLVEQSGANVTVGTLLLGSAVLGLLTFVVVYRLTGWALLGFPPASWSASCPRSCCATCARSGCGSSRTSSPRRWI